MYDSGVKISEFMNSIKNEVDIRDEVPNTVFAEALDNLVQFVYSSLVKELKIVEGKDDVIVKPHSITPHKFHRNPELEEYTVEVKKRDGEAYEDIKHVYVNDVELLRANLYDAKLLGDAYARMADTDMKSKFLIVLQNKTINRYEDKDINAEDKTRVEIVYRVRPEHIRALSNGFTQGNVPLPYEYLEMAKARVRGEVYKAVNEDTLAAKWLNDYNNMLESFKLWIATGA